MSEKITKEMVDTYLELHRKITGRLMEILPALAEINPKEYSNIEAEYYNPKPDYFSVGGWGWHGCEWEQNVVPTHYIYEENCLEHERKKVEEKIAKENQERLLKEQRRKEEKELRDRQEYERLKKKFDS